MPPETNKKLIDTIKIFVIYGCLLWPINYLLGTILGSMNFYAGSYSSFSIVGIIMSLIMGVIFSALGGVIFYFLYNPVHNWVKGNGFLSKHITNMFTFFWKPFLVGTIIGAAFGLLGMLGIGALMTSVAGAAGAIGFGAMFVGWIIMLVVHVVVYYFYSKLIAAKLGALYAW